MLNHILVDLERVVISYFHVMLTIYLSNYFIDGLHISNVCLRYNVSLLHLLLKVTKAQALHIINRSLSSEHGGQGFILLYFLRLFPRKDWSPLLSTRSISF